MKLLVGTVLRWTRVYSDILIQTHLVSFTVSSLFKFWVYHQQFSSLKGCPPITIPTLYTWTTEGRETIYKPSILKILATPCCKLHVICLVFFSRAEKNPLVWCLIAFFLFLACWPIILWYHYVQCKSISGKHF